MTFETMYVKNPALKFGVIDHMLSDAIETARKRWKRSSVPPPGSRNK